MLNIFMYNMDLSILVFKSKKKSAEESNQIVPDQTAHKSSLIWDYFVCIYFSCLSDLVLSEVPKEFT